MHQFTQTIILALAVSISVTTHSSTHAGAASADETITDGPAASWSTLLHQWIGNGSLCDAPGGVLLAHTPNGDFLEAAGQTTMAGDQPVGPTDRFQIGSNTKSFTVVLALQLQEEGKLSLDDALDRWLPGWAGQIAGTDKITLRHLASNTSGIPDYADPLMQPIVDGNDQPALAEAWDPPELVQFALKQGSLDFEPGTAWAYSSTNFILLGLVIEAVSGQTLPELYQQRIFTPLGMTATEYPTGVPRDGSMVRGYYHLEDGTMADMTGWNTSQGGAAGAIISTAGDMLRYAEGLMTGRLFEKPSTLEEMLSFRELDLMEGGIFMQAYALGLINFRNEEVRLVGHAGQTPGFQSVWAAVPGKDIYLVLLTNSGTCSAALFPIGVTRELLGTAPDSEP